MGRGGFTDTPMRGAAEGEEVLLKTKAGDVGFLRTVLRVVLDFNNSSAENRAEYYKVKKAADEAKAAAGERRRTSRAKLEQKTSKVSRAEVAEHNDVHDCWMVIKGKVYDVTDFAATHPGGRVIYTYAGKDATDVFAAFHAGGTWSQLSELQVGELAEEDATKPEDPIVQDFRNLRAKMVAEGLFKSDKLYYVYKTLSTLSIALLAYGALSAWGSSLSGMLFSAFLLGLFWQQCGWLAHDFCHNQVFRNRTYNTWGGFLVGSVWGGFSVDWWKGKHNTHHAAPNEITAGGMPVDPDIDTLPLIAWSPELLSNVHDAAYRAFIRLQHYLFFPILCFARMSWAQQSATHPFDTIKHTANVQPRVEKLSIALHYAWLLLFAFSQLPLLRGVGFLLASQMMSGIMLSLVFVQSHNGMEIYHEPKDFFTAQLVSTRNIFGALSDRVYGPFNDWFTGGLNYQIEHHLFPTMPRHRLSKAQVHVMEVCKKHGLVYENCSMTEGTVRVLSALADIAALA